MITNTRQMPSRQEQPKAKRDAAKRSPDQREPLEPRELPLHWRTQTCTFIRAVIGQARLELRVDAHSDARKLEEEEEIHFR